MEKKKEYVAPALVSITFKTERGYSSSLLTMTALFDAEEQQQMEDYSTANGWTSGSNSFWD